MCAYFVNDNTAMPSNQTPDEAPLLSVVVITLNEAHNLPRLLHAVSGWADEVLVFDSGSTDGTVALAEAGGARVVNCPWEGWSKTKNKANAAAKGQWILSLDADEAPDAACAAAIRQHIQGGMRTPDGRWRVGEVNRMTHYCGQWVHHSGWFPDLNIRLWPHGAAQWAGAIHEAPVFQEPTEKVGLSGIVEHYSYPHRADHLSQIEKFGKVWAEDQFALGRSTPPVLAGLKVIAQWVKTFCIKRGFLDGRTGWTIARLSAWATWRKHARLRAMHVGKTLTPQKILVARTDALGDLVLTLPMLRALRKRFPNAQIDLLVRPYAAALACASQDVDGVLIWEDGKATTGSHDTGDALIRHEYDAVVLAYPDAQVVHSCVRAGIPIRLGTARRRHTFGRMTHPNWDSRKDSGGHESWHGLRLLMPLGIEASNSSFQDTLIRPPVADDAVKEALSGMSQAPVLLHPGSHGSAGNWSPERFAALASSLVRSGMTVAFTGTAQEGRDFAPYFPEVEGAVSWFGRFDLNQLLAAQSGSQAVVASSTGPLHTATAMGVPGIGLYGKTAPAWAARWAPIGPQVTVLEADSVDPDGHLDISVERVKAAVLAFSDASFES